MVNFFLDIPILFDIMIIVLVNNEKKLREVTKMKKILLPLVITLFISFFPVLCMGQSSGLFTDEAKPEYVAGEILIDFKDDVSKSDIEKFKEKYHLNNLELNSQYSAKEELFKANVNEEQMDELISSISRDEYVEYIEPDYLYQAYSTTPDDPLYKYQWHMDQINVRGAWDINTGEDVIVAVIDTGVAYLNYDKFHRAEDLENTMFTEGYDFVNDKPQACDDNCHGTHVAGTIAQSTYNGKGCIGVAYKCKIMPLKVLNGQGFGSTGDIADAIRYAADHGAKVINMSLGGPFSSKIMADACTYAYNKGVVIVCAAGNSGSTRIGYPAGYPECISVSATRYDKEITFYSNRGKSIDIAAPGGDLRVDQNGDGKKDGVLQNTIGVRNPSIDDYYLFQGTSMASPHVAGVAAMLVSSGITNPATVEEILKDSADKNVPKELEYGYGAGIVNAHGALLHAVLLRGFVKLLLALFFIGGFVFFLCQRNCIISYSALYVIGSVIGSCGLFFLPFFGLTPPLYKDIICNGFPQWDIAIFGASSHQHPIFYSALFPLALYFLFGKISLLNRLVMGFNLGVAAHLTYCLMTSDANMILIPQGLDKIWLLVNIAICLYISLDIAKGMTVKEEVFDETPSPEPEA